MTLIYKIKHILRIYLKTLFTLLLTLVEYLNTKNQNLIIVEIE